MIVSLLIPARNERDVIGKMVRMTLAVYPDVIRHVIVVDDGSTDTTAAVVGKLASRDKRIILIKRLPPHGVGLAIREGLRHIPEDTTHILTMDADFIRNIPDLEEFFAAIGKYDGIIGSRYLAPHSLIRYPLLKKFFNRAFHLLVRMRYGVKLHDLTNNFKLYKKDIFARLPLTADGFAVNAQTGLYPVLLGYHITELPVTWFARERDMGYSKFKLLTVAPGYWKALLEAASLKNR